MKEEVKSFNFTGSLPLDSVPFYGKDYIGEDERILGAYVVDEDIGLITDKKIIMFENTKVPVLKRDILTIPYDVMAAHSISFMARSAEMRISLKDGNRLIFKFSSMGDFDKMKIRYIYNAISFLICKQPVPEKIIKKLVENDFSFNR